MKHIQIGNSHWQATAFEKGWRLMLVRWRYHQGYDIKEMNTRDRLVQWLDRHQLGKGCSRTMIAVWDLDQFLTLLTLSGEFQPVSVR